MFEAERHRGRLGDDDVLFAPEVWPALRAATDELSWVLDRSYGQKAAAKLVGDRHSLRERQPSFGRTPRRPRSWTSDRDAGDALNGEWLP